MCLGFRDVYLRLFAIQLADGLTFSDVGKGLMDFEFWQFSQAKLIFEQLLSIG